jgi:hypothetical protein
MQAAGGEPVGCARETVGHAYHDCFLQAEHVFQLGKIRHYLHDGEFGRARVAEQVGNAFVEEQLQKSGTAGDLDHIGSIESKLAIRRLQRNNRGQAFPLAVSTGL